MRRSPWVDIVMIFAFHEGKAAYRLLARPDERLANRYQKLCFALVRLNRRSIRLIHTNELIKDIRRLALLTEQISCKTKP